MSNPFDTVDEQAIPWQRTPSIYQHIQRHIDPETGRLLPEGDTLPDEEARHGGQEIRWASGALEGAFGSHGNPQDKEDKASVVAKHITRIANDDSYADKVALYRLLMADDLMGYIDDAINKIFQAGIMPNLNLYAFMQFLSTNAPDRGPVKFAIVMFGVMYASPEKEVVMLLGLHEEFTLYSAVALNNMQESPDRDLWALAKKVHGWGRIHLVRRLYKTRIAEIKSWLLREGFRNSVMYEYVTV